MHSIQLNPSLPKMEDSNTEESKMPPEKKFHNTMALKEIRKCLQTYPLQPLHVAKISNHVDSKQKVGTVVLPLWQKKNHGVFTWKPSLALIHSFFSLCIASRLSQLRVRSWRWLCLIFERQQEMYVTSAVSREYSCLSHKLCHLSRDPRGHSKSSNPVKSLNNAKIIQNVQSFQSPFTNGINNRYS